MPINESLLIAAPMLQDYLVDTSSGLPLSAGIVTCYQDNNRTTLKNWYYQTGIPGDYSYVQLPNPMTLSAVGTIVDVNGQDTIPFFYPYASDNITIETYYITVDNANGQRMFSRQNFPFLPSASPTPPPPSNFENAQNYIVNNSFWRAIGVVGTGTNIGTLNNTIVISGNTLNYTTIAPSQHDTFSMPDLIYAKSTNGATETVTFKKFTSTSALTNDVLPELYLNHNCTGAQAGETQKFYQYPISLHITQLQNQTFTVTIQAQAADTNPNNVINLYLFQYTGTGTTAPNPILLTPSGFTLTSNWKKYTVTYTFPSTTGLSLSAAGDDAFYLQIGMPLAETCNINFTLPSLYLTPLDNVPANNFTTYDQIDSIISTPRTGDVRTSLNSFAPFGWVLCNDGVISNSGTFTLPTNVPSARQNVDTWPLFNLLWSQFSDIDTGSNANPAAQMYTSAGAATNYGATAIADWNANKQLQLTLMLGRALIGLPPAMGITYTYNSAPSWNSGVNGFFTAVSPFASAKLLYIGTPVFLTGTMPTSGNFTAFTVYYAIPSFDGSSTTQFQLATTYANAIAGTAIAAGSASNNGSNIICNFILGGGGLGNFAFGEFSHAQQQIEMFLHNHTVTPAQDLYQPSGGTNLPATGFNSNASTPYTFNTTFNGGTKRMNIVQPVAYMNVFLKL